MSIPTDHKQAAIEQWTNDPCGAVRSEGELGSREYFEKLLEARREYGGWMAEAIDYVGARGLDVLDVGCGQGIDLVEYALAGARPTGVDLTPRHAELARQHVAAMGFEVTVVNGDAEDLPFETGSFDRVSSNGVLHHTPDMPAALRAINRVLRPGGQARVIVYSRDSFHYWLEQVLFQGIKLGGLRREGSMEGVLSAGVEYSSVDARPLVRVYGRRQLKRMMLEAQFSDVTVAAYHYQPTDTRFTSRLNPVRHRALLDRLGRVGGWYLVAIGTKSAS